MVSLLSNADPNDFGLGKKKAFSFGLGNIRAFYFGLGKRSADELVAPGRKERGTICFTKLGSVCCLPAKMIKNKSDH